MSLKPIKSLKLSSDFKQRNIFFSDFEALLYNNQYYVSCFVINSNSLLNPCYSVIKYKNNSNIEIESRNLVLSFIRQCLLFAKNSKHKETIVYFHNLGKFDGFFLINNISSLHGLKVKIITRDNTLYEIKIISDDVEIKFRDSFLLFPSSLEKIGELLGEKKINFPEIVAPFERYNDDKFRSLLVEYCKQDVKILQKLISWYYNYIKNQYYIDIHDCLTLSSLAFRIYRTHFYSNSSIYQSHGFMDTFIRKSYRGGIVDVYKPILEDGYYYDVNSLYPYVMSISDMPVGPGLYGKITSQDSFDLDNFFGFISVKVKTPQNMYIPFLTVNHKMSGLISPVGEWTDIYFSEEIKYAKTLGYEFEYYNYYKFDRKVIFFDYVTKIYKDRIENKDKPSLANVSKLLLNSLYGRFGMSNSIYKNLFLKNTKKDRQLLRDLKLIYDTKIVNVFENNNTEEKNSLTLIRYNQVPNLDHIINLYKRGYISDSAYNDFLKEPEKKTGDLNISVHIASAITAYARIYMHKLKTQYKDSLYYSDTDSIIVDKPISDDLISKTELGLLKLEYKIKRGIFIAPKLYYIESEDNEIIKSKGINSKLLNYDDFFSLYKDESVKIKTIQNFVRNIKTYTIGISDKNIELRGNFTKRKKIFNFAGHWVDTKPISYSNYK